MAAEDKGVRQPKMDETESREAWHAAQRYAYYLAHGGAPSRVFVPGVVLDPGEDAAFATWADYSRFYGDDGSYTHTQGMFLGSWQFMAVGYAATAMANSIRKRKAEARTVPRWRDLSRSHVVATDRRLLVQVPNRGYLSFWYAGMRELYPEPRQWGVVMVWPDAAPLRLTGLSAPYLCVHVAAHVMPARWTEHPALAELARGPVDGV